MLLPSAAAADDATQQTKTTATGDKDDEDEEEKPSQPRSRSAADRRENEAELLRRAGVALKELMGTLRAPGKGD